MLASADILTEAIEGCELADLHGLDSEILTVTIEDAIGILPSERRQCADVCIDALHAAFARHRSSQIDEFRGEKALICTCFGVTEEMIDDLIGSGKPRSVDEVTAACRAGGGCGSCRMLIQEMLDNA
jgi:NifU-like protein